MHVKFVHCFALALVAGVCLGASPYDELMPMPRRVEKAGGTASAGALRNVRVVRGSVPGAAENVADQAYVLDVAPDRVTITAGGAAGENWARVTLEQLRRLSGGDAVPCGRVTDWPVMRWRGFMMDTGRNYLDMDSLKDLIDMMGRYKLNLFHWHFTEYFGWRLASAKYPQVQERGYYDPFGHRHRGKFYSQDEFREIVAYAGARGVTVMPEFDLPGHSQAFREAFGFKTMKDPGVKEVVVDLINELCALAPKEQMPFIHLGGDEVWDAWEKIEPETMTAWIDTVSANGRTAVTWLPGQKHTAKGPCAPMLWGGKKAKEVDGPYFAAGCYIEHLAPFVLLNVAAYSNPMRGTDVDSRFLGGIFCDWHDSAVGLPYAKTFREVPVFPAFVMLGDLYWHGRDDYSHADRFAATRLPALDDPLLDVAREIERRTIAQRDRVLTDLKHPFHFVRQTQMRWRLTDKDGTLLAKDIAQATVFPRVANDSVANYVNAPTGTVYMETWILSPSDREIGAWISLTEYDRDIGRSFAGGTPQRGQWNLHGGSVEVNGERIEPPVWEQPGLTWGQETPLVRSNFVAEEIPFTNDEWCMREPTRVHLKKGWNHVRLTLPMTKPVTGWWRCPRWVGTFMPVAGTTDHPHEIDDLEYSSEPKP